MTEQQAAAAQGESSYVPAGAGRALTVLGDTMHVKVAGRDTGGAYAVWEVTVQPGGGPPPHRHEREHEDFCVLEGDFEFHREGQAPLRGTAGGYVHTPRGVVHTFKNVGGSPGRLLVIAAPAGVEGFFADVSEGVGHLTGPPTPEQVGFVVATAARYGIQIQGPPPPPAQSGATTISG